MIRSRAVKVMPGETTLEDFHAIKGFPWASSGVLRDVLPDVSRPILSRDEPPFVLAEERPVPRNMKISQDILKEGRIHARLCQMQEIVSQRILPSRLGTFSGLSHQDGGSNQDRPSVS